MKKLKIILLLVLSLHTLSGFTQPKGKAAEIYTLINEARINPKAFLTTHRTNMLNSGWKYVGCYGYNGAGMYNYIQNFAKD